MKQTALLLALCLTTSSYAATVYNCNGTYQQTPCADDEGTTVNVSGAGAATAPSAGSGLVQDYKRKIQVNQLIERGRVAPGMTPDEVRSAWGEPTTINDTLSKYGDRQQWVYRRDHAGADYVHFDEGLVSSVSQNPGVAVRPRERCPSPNDMRNLEMAARSHVQTDTEREYNMRRLEQAEACLRRQ